jgi:uncharacterized repeat protein (TIGR01451 family)
VSFISIDTNSEGGVTPVSASGNIDDPQFQWLEGELQAASQRNELIVIFGHHPVRSLNADVPDEAAPPCTVNDSHGHDINPGCDLDPRSSEPVHLGEDPQPGDPRESLVELLDRFPNVVAYVPGHTHENRITSFTRNDSSVWWELNTSAVADWPQQHRLIDMMDNRDGTLSIFSAVLDHASPAASPPPGDASSFDAAQLASIARTFSYNDPQADLGADGGPADQNVELLVEDPRPGADLSIAKSDSPDPVTAGAQLTYNLEVHNTGPAGSQQTMVTDELPSGVEFVSATSSQGSCSQAAGTVTCDLGTLASGGSASVQVKVRPQNAGTITNRASVEGNVKDTNPANDSDTETTTVQAGADLEIVKSDSPDPAAIGKLLTYTLTVRNHGPSDATGVVVTDRLPSRVNFVSASASQGTCAFSKGTVTCQLGSIPSGGSATVTIRVTPRNVGALSNTASVKATQQDPASASNSDTESTTVRAM